jgi:hypothetical protein
MWFAPSLYTWDRNGVAVIKFAVFCTVGNLDRCTPVCKLHVAFKIPYVYNYISKLCRTSAEVILNHVNPNVHGTGQGEANHRKYRRLKLGTSQAYDHSANCTFRVVK